MSRILALQEMIRSMPVSGFLAVHRHQPSHAFLTQTILLDIIQLLLIPLKHQSYCKCAISTSENDKELLKDYMQSSSLIITQNVD